MTEQELVAVIAKFLQQDGYRVRREVPNMGQSMDLAATKNRWLTAVEVKLHDWRGALDQCRAHELVADFICVAVATRDVSQDLLREASERGYGVIHFSQHCGKCCWASRPQRNQRVWPAQRSRLSRSLREIGHVG